MIFVKFYVHTNNNNNIIIIIIILFNITLYLYLQTASDWLYVCPKGIKKLLLYTKKEYNDPVIYITENGNYTKSNFYCL